MSDSTASLGRKITGADDLHSVVRTMKALAASSIGQYENSVLALGDYYRTVELGLAACFQGGADYGLDHAGPSDRATLGAVVFGSDQGLVGQFNEVVADFTIQTLAKLPGKPRIWAVGERVSTRLEDAHFPIAGFFAVPSSVKGITSLVGQIQIQSETDRAKYGYHRIYLFHNRPQSRASYEPMVQRLLPLDGTWQQNLAGMKWPTQNLPQVMSGEASTLRALIREYHFISLFRACAESLASENASRLTAMERADRNIQDLLETLRGDFNRLRQNGIDEELFDVISGFEALA